MPRKDLPIDSTISDAIGPTTACMLIVEIGPGGRVAIQDLTDNSVPVNNLIIPVVLCVNLHKLYIGYSSNGCFATL